jgi:HlyD family secretion protein
MTERTVNAGGSSRAARNRKRALLLLAGLIVAVVAIVLINQRVRAPGAVEVYAATAEVRTIRSAVTGPGTVTPEKQVKISSGVMGRVVRVAVKEGQAVAEGDLLVQIEPTQFEARVREGEGALEGARSRVVLQESRLEKLQLDLKRQTELGDRALVSDKEIEGVKTDVRVTQAELEAARHAVREGEARLASVRDDLEKATIRAPTSGVVSSLDVEEGEIAIMGTMNYAGTVLLTLSDLSQMEVDAEIDETDVLDVALGQEAVVHVDAMEDSTLRGTVVEISSSAEKKRAGSVEESTVFRVRVRIENGRDTLKPGMTADVEIQTAEKADVLSIPIQAVVRRPPSGEPKEKNDLEKEDTPARRPSRAKDGEDVDGVFVMEGKKVEFRAIETGISDETDIEVVSGLSKGDQVVTGPYRALAQLKNGKRVRVAEEKEKDTGRADRD